jgi:hypothetical protein
VDAAAAFIERWRPVLESGALVKFAYGPRGEVSGNHCEVADQVVGTLGLKQIGFNWELLDAAAPEGSPRSGEGELMKALTQNLANPSHPWLSDAQANECASEFLGLFDAATLTLVSNRYDGLWNPIAGGSTEWGFVGFDEAQVVLLLLAD